MALSTNPASSRNHYEVLNVSPTATIAEIKAAHRSLALKLHPDKKNGFRGDDDGSRILLSSLLSTTNITTTTTTGRPMGMKPMSMDTMDNGPVMENSPFGQDEEDTAENESVHSQHIKEERDATFTKVQEAWECLRDVNRRKEYDETLRRKHKQTQLKLESAVCVLLSEMECEICEVEEEGEELDVKDKGDEKLDSDEVTVKVLSQKSGKDVVHSNVDGTGGPPAQQHCSTSLQHVFIYPCRCGDTFEILEEELLECSLTANFGGGDVNDDRRCGNAQRKQQPVNRIWECGSCSLAIRVIIDTRTNLNLRR